MRPWLWDLALGGFFLALYAFTLSPGLLPADAGEFQLVGAALGVAHPPGFALYTLLAWLSTRLLFFIAPATAVNLLSALLAALALVLLNRAVRRLTHSTVAGLGAALALGFSTTFWAQATTANIRMPTALAVAFALDRLVIYRQSLSPQGHEGPKNQNPRPSWPGVFVVNRPLALLTFALGLGVSHHGSLVFIAALLGLYTLWLDPARLRRPWPLLWGLVPFLAWLYFPLRAGAFGAPPRLATLDGFLEHVLALGFRGDILYFANLKDLPDRLLIFGNILTFEFTWPLLLLTVLGGVAVLWQERAFGIALLAAFAAHSFIAVTYRAPQTVEYLLPSYVLMAVLIGFALAGLFHLLIAQSPNHPITLLAALVVLALQSRAAFPSYLALARDASTRTYAETVLASAPSGAVILAAWHRVTPLWYLQVVEGRRPDVEVRYVFPRSASLAQDWVDEIRAALPAPHFSTGGVKESAGPARPVVVTSFYRPQFESLPYRFLPSGPAWEVRAGPLLTPPADLTGAQTFGEWAFLGYRLEPSLSPRPSVDPVDLIAAWRTSGLPQDINFFVHLVGPDGRLYGQMDVSHPASRYVSGEVLLDRYHILPYPDAPPGDYTLAFGAYRPDGVRLAEVNAQTIRLDPPARPRDAAHAVVPLGASLLLTGHSVRPSGPLHPGEALTVELHFLAARPITQDLAVRVDLAGAGWRVVSEGTPVGGAIPTLKWIAGSRLTDRRTLTIPADAPSGAAELGLLLYDAFTQQALPILDRDLAASGPVLPLGTLEIVGP